MADADDYHSVFQELRSAYLASADDVDDGADYHNGFPPKFNSVQEPPSSAVFGRKKERFMSHIQTTRQDNS